MQQALALLREVRELWQWTLTHLDLPLDEAVGALRAFAAAPPLQTPSSPAGDATLFSLVEDHRLRASWKTQIRAGLRGIFGGSAFTPILAECQRIHDEVLRGRVWVALHMHAGDGNVHTNIPVNSDNYEMLQTAHRAVARIMQLARRSTA